MQEPHLLPGSRGEPRPAGDPAPDGSSPAAGTDGRSARATLWPAAVAVSFVLAQLMLVAPGLGLGWDETVYVSQVGRQGPAAFLSAPRARGVSFLAAPVAALSTSVLALRIWLAVLSGLGLFLALRVWRPLLPAPVIALAGALFASLWITLYYGPQVMPNLWVAYGALAAVGFFLRTARDPGDSLSLVGLAAAVAFVALMRPPDAVPLVLLLAAASLLVRAWRRPVLWCVLAAGVLVGSAEWVIEAYVRYGGLVARLDRASEIQGDVGWYVAVDDHVRALGGRTLCRPCDVPWENPVTALWFLALPLAVAGGVRAAARTRHRTATVMATVTGCALALPYLFTIDYAAPRFLFPAYALLSLPVAVLLVRLAGIGTSWRPALLGLCALALLGHLAVQYKVLDSVTRRVRTDTVTLSRIAAELRAHGVRPPCVVTGKDAIRIAYRAGCASRQPAGHDAAITPAGLARAAERQPVAVLLSRGGTVPAYARGWAAYQLPDLPQQPGFHMLVSPSAQN
ncbi:hypothetical protein [Streptomyces sp. TRM49041]|uniref:hypothetical protein n=1 Tax=Streptomyces sp. TRM49041 TaxID=2603216 RepID=UPI0011EDCB64|nr:hypothetical protein [Streptomyces sp. TRM49041]